ncbi:MAG: hypothetical protein U1E76_12260 [Planctomycetota bacterium]
MPAPAELTHDVADELARSTSSARMDVLIAVRSWCRLAQLANYPSAAARAQVARALARAPDRRTRARG